jgi:hypothetical protein
LGQRVRQTKHSPSGAQNQSTVLIDFIERCHAFFGLAIPDEPYLTSKYSDFDPK